MFAELAMSEGQRYVLVITGLGTYVFSAQDFLNVAPT